MRGIPSNANSRVQCNKSKREKGQFVPSILPKGRQSLISAPSCHKTCNLCRWDSNPTPPRAHTHTHPHTHANTRLRNYRRPRCLLVQPPVAASPPCPPVPPMPQCPHARPHELSGVFCFFLPLWLPPLPLTAQGRTRTQEEGGIDISAGGLGGAWPTEPYFPKQISEGCHPTEACSRPTVSSSRRSVCAVLLSNSLSMRSLFQWGLPVYTVWPLVLVNCMVDWLLVVECDSCAKLGKHGPICVVSASW